MKSTIMVQIVDCDELKAPESSVIRVVKQYAVQTSLTEIQKDELWKPVYGDYSDHGPPPYSINRREL